MDTTTIGELTVSQLCLGSMFFGTTVDEAMSFRLLDQFVEAGGTFVDTANCYAFWADGGTGDESEELLGRWFASRRTDGIVLSTKVGSRPTGHPDGWPENAEGLAGPTIARAVRDSLRRLGRDHVELLYTHLDDRDTALVETLGAIGELVEDGVVDEIGCSNIAAWRIASAQQVAERCGLPRYVATQLRHSYVRPDPDVDIGMQVTIDHEHRDLAASTDLRLVGYSPLLSGAYSDRTDRSFPPAYEHAANHERLRRLRTVAHDVGATQNQVVLAWMLQSNPTVVPVVAASTSEQLAENLAAVDVRLDASHVELLDAPVQATSD
jgi:aryl-alcohol dehydrogenase-like predicted oxidoreductase